MTQELAARVGSTPTLVFSQGFSLEFLLDACCDAQKEQKVLETYLPFLQRWLQSRVPRWTLETFDFNSLVQAVFSPTLQKAKEIGISRGGQFQILLRQALLSQMDCVVRRMQAEAETDNAGGYRATRSLSFLEEKVGREALNRYDGAFQRLPLEDQEAIFARMELGLNYHQIASVLALETADSRKAVVQSLVHLVEGMSHGA